MSRIIQRGGDVLVRVLSITLIAAATSFAAAFFFAHGCAASPVTGRVTDVNGRPVSKAKLSIDGQTTLTNHAGYFTIPPLSLGKYNLRVEHPRYAVSIKPVNLTQEKESSLRIVLTAVKTRRFKSFRRVNRVRSRRLELTVPANSLVDEDGKPARSGSLRFSVLNVRGNGLRAMPGRFRGRTPDGKTVNLESVGAASLVFSSKGKKLQVRKGKKLTMFLPYQGKLVPGQTTVPMWYLDEKAGIWKSQGIGRIVRRKGKLWVKAALPHLSWWNCDQPWHNKTTILVRKIRLNNGDLIEGAGIAARGLDYNGYTYQKIPRGETGYCLEVKPNARVRLRAFHYGMDGLSEYKKVLRTPAGPSSCTRNPADGIVIDEIVFKKPISTGTCVRGKLEISAGDDFSDLRIEGVRFQLHIGHYNLIGRGEQSVDEDGNFCIDNAQASARLTLNRKLKLARLTDKKYYLSPIESSLALTVPDSSRGSCRENVSACHDMGRIKFKAFRVNSSAGKNSCGRFRVTRNAGQIIGGGCLDQNQVFERIGLKSGGQLVGCVLDQDGNILIICSPDDGLRMIDKSNISEQRFLPQN